MNAANRYIASLYESCVDQQLDVEAIRLRLASHGIRRTSAQVADDLTHTYGFHGYAASHPAAPAMTVQQWDDWIDGKTPCPCYQTTVS